MLLRRRERGARCRSVAQLELVLDDREVRRDEMFGRNGRGRHREDALRVGEAIACVRGTHARDAAGQQRKRQRGVVAPPLGGCKAEQERRQRARAEQREHERERERRGEHREIDDDGIPVPAREGQAVVERLLQPGGRQSAAEQHALDLLRAVVVREDVGGCEPEHGVGELPAEQHRHGQHDGEQQVALLIGILLHSCLSAVRVAPGSCPPSCRTHAGRSVRSQWQYSAGNRSQRCKSSAPLPPALLPRGLMNA